MADWKLKRCNNVAPGKYRDLLLYFKSTVHAYHGIPSKNVENNVHGAQGIERVIFFYIQFGCCCYGLLEAVEHRMGKTGRIDRSPNKVIVNKTQKKQYTNQAKKKVKGLTHHYVFVY